ncbi:hypothetical protein NW766_004428 [Fusarium irregulare]|uniref:Heterokaryon incompatibility domain-containing protein n=1 Tax=Fusarium irregulare TaxID=2494466 RepID=A0A9W8U9W3_9HYPO|nr:hypothetical protein NW766_004428 [Fusarium irregulare]
MGDNDVSVSQITHCPTCRFIKIRDTSQKTTSRPWGESPPSGAGPAESQLVSYSRPFELERATHPTLSYQAALELFHGDTSWSSGDASICSLCDHWVHGLFTREWEPESPIARITLGSFEELEARLNCHVCRFFSETMSQSSFEIDDTRILALELGGDSWGKSCKYRATAIISYTDAEEFPHITRIEKMECPQFTVLDEIDIKPGFAKPNANWNRLRLWYSGLPPTTNGQSISADGHGPMRTALPKGFCLVNVPEARLVETDGVQIPEYAALSYVWGKSDEEITTTTENFETLKLCGRFREKDVPVLFKDAFQVCSQLGIDYFWIDRICVVQDDEKRKSAQLEAMGRIYSKAKFTIVSSEPSFLRQGLSGVSQFREPPRYLCVGDKVLQEGLLSENVMIFDQDMVYMYSRASENLYVEGFRELEFAKPNYISASLVPEDKQYSDQVNEYSTRLLTFGSDKADAFLGVLNTFGEHQYGLPNRIIDQAMLWHYTYEPARAAPRFPKHEFPSWSWTSTVGRIEYRHLPSNKRPLFSVATWATVEIDQSSKKPLVKLLDGLQYGQNSEAAQRLKTIRDYIPPFENDPAAVAMAANLCESYRLIEGRFGDETYGDTSKSRENNLANLGRWKSYS